MKLKWVFRGVGILIILVFIFFSMWQTDILSRILTPLREKTIAGVISFTEISAPPIGNQPVGIAHGTMVRIGPPWWAWTELVVAAIVYSGALGWFLGQRSRRK